MCRAETDKIEQFDPTYYSKMYTRIWSTVITCYLDYYLLEFYNRQDEKTKEEQSRHTVLVHLTYLVQKDLCLNLWKICYDKNADSSTISKLNTYLRKHNVSSAYKQSAHMKQMGYCIREARNKYVAHLDVESTENSISTSSMKQLLDDAKDALNHLCLEEYGVKKITDISLSKMDLNITLDAISILRSVT